MSTQLEQCQFSESIQKLELFISCRQLDDLDTVSVSDPFVVLYLLNSQKKWLKIGQTELIWNNLNPNFATSFQIEYQFEAQQHLKLEVHHFVSQTQSKIIGIAETTVAEIAGSKDQLLMADLFNSQKKKSGKIIVKADQVKQCNDEVEITVSGQNLPDTRFWFWHGANPFLRFYRLRKDDTNPVLVYESEFIKDSSNPTWKPISCRAQKLCNGDYQMPIKVELWDYRTSGKHLYLGETSFCIEELRDAFLQNKPFLKEFRNKQKNNSPAGTINFDNFILKQKHTFLDYRQGGQQLNLILAIDFTASNGNPKEKNSLHYMTENGNPSQYLQAITSVVEILINYDYDKKVPVYGFGCKPKFNVLNTNQTLHIFPLNDNPDDPEVYGLDGIVQVYKNAVQKMQLDGPTYIHPVLAKAMEMAQEVKDKGSENYLILMILTDGQTDDLQASIDDVVASSHLPLSIIIVGIGNADFKKMNILDNDDKSMVNSKGFKAIRDLVQFVPFNEFKNDPALLSKEVLAELPDQLVEYMELMKIPPKPPSYQKNNIQMSQPMQNVFPQLQVELTDQQQQQYKSMIQDVQANQQSVKFGIATQAFGQGLAQQGFLNNFVKQAPSSDPNPQQ
ncbi:unnamed protein product (macronuclear) [Paramecium tetraurelia]|uniref:C2 domain-containing protein n=1 Tax=Paramecium tetraurelia TaxID=5888 RepID=A0DTA6_PARTE|nr:uncharacterized protein GSPATT00019966001 [Paramecium tetraurelia]CAK86273.1 unnamed protein product [Paramecium tetraurelia]|eukprot:XP_001453670.1 hypothetical protein (macronuclear) [Paramecium tetraurelia strain d4-2]